MGRSVNISTTIPPPLTMVERFKISPARQKELTDILDESQAQLDAESGVSSDFTHGNLSANPRFVPFDADYIEGLRAGNQHTGEHFLTYFTRLLQLKLRSRLQSPMAIEDVLQETFARVLKALSGDALRRPSQLGAFVNTVCNNVLFEHYRSSARSEALDAGGLSEAYPSRADVFDIASASQMRAKVQEILLEIPARDRALLKAVFLDERDRDDVCREFGVDREYLRVLIHRAKVEFRKAFIKNLSDSPKEVNAKPGRRHKNASSSS
jgi:RNA polymerase sigma-70 factor, ECF subfamily